jgi:hypothetical protein
MFFVKGASNFFNLCGLNFLQVYEENMPLAFTTTYTKKNLRSFLLCDTMLLLKVAINNAG